MNYSILFKRITQLGAELISAGCSSDSLNYRLEYIGKKYGFTEMELTINPNQLASTAIAPDGTQVTSISHIEFDECNFGKLEALDAYSQQVIQELPSAEEINAAIQNINSPQAQPKWVDLIFTILMCTAFAISFNANLYDVPTSIMVSTVLYFVSLSVKKISTNMFIDNTVLSFVAAFFVLIGYNKIGLCQNPESISLGIIMLLIKGLGISDGLWFLLNKDTSIGFHKISEAMIGAFGIAIGTAIPYLIFFTGEPRVVSGNDNLVIETIAVMLGNVACAKLCGASNKLVPYVAGITAISWLVYSEAYLLTAKPVISILLGAIATCMLSAIFSIRLGVLPSILNTICILPLIPGSKLFYLQMAMVMKNSSLALANFSSLITYCLAIAVGYSINILIFNPKSIEKRIYRRNQIIEARDE